MFRVELIESFKYNTIVLLIAVLLDCFYQDLVENIVENI